MGKPKTKYSINDRNNAFKRYVKGKLKDKGYSLPVLAKELGILETTIKKWHFDYKWSERFRELKRKAREKLENQIAEEEAEYQIDVRHKLIDLAKETEDKRKEKNIVVTKSGDVREVPVNPFEFSTLAAIERSSYMDIAKIDGLIVDRSKQDISAKVIPLLGGVSKTTNAIQTNDSTEEDNEANEED